jgi:hypothetical protein
MLEFQTFEDDWIKLEMPKQLKLKVPKRFKQTHQGVAYLFSGNTTRGQAASHVELAIVLDEPPVLREAAKNVILRVPSCEMWLGVEIRTIRKGPCSFGDGGLEVIVRYTNPIKVSYRWNVLYQLAGHHVFVDLSGGGDFDAFEAMGRAIIGSLRLKKAGASRA